MMRPWGRLLTVLTLAATLLAVEACKPTTDTGKPPPATDVKRTIPDKAESGSIKAIMAKLTKGPDSLTPVIGKELEADPPPWDKIQAQTREFAEVAATMGSYAPPMGSKDSWHKFTTSYAEAATALDKAAQAKNKDEAVTAHQTLARSCQECHKAHRPKK